ncbi:MAG: hypothetical protein ACPGVN_06670 [Alphaproteobacteria bacterium]
MRFFVLSLLAGSFVLTSCGSKTGVDTHSKEFANVRHSARSASTDIQANAFANPTSEVSGEQAFEIRSEFANMACENLALEDKRLTDLGQKENPSFEDMMTQLELLEIRAALYARCNQPSLGQSHDPQFTVPMHDTMAAEQSAQIRRQHGLETGQHAILSVADPINIERVAPSPEYVQMPSYTAPNVMQTPVAEEPVSIMADYPIIKPKIDFVPAAKPTENYRIVDRSGNVVHVRSVVYK